MTLDLFPATRPPRAPTVPLPRTPTALEGAPHAPTAPDEGAHADEQGLGAKCAPSAPLPRASTAQEGASPPTRLWPMPWAEAVDQALALGWPRRLILKGVTDEPKPEPDYIGVRVPLEDVVWRQSLVEDGHPRQVLDVLRVDDSVVLLGERDAFGGQVLSRFRRWPFTTVPPWRREAS